jgi:hypothetical protein
MGLSEFLQSPELLRFARTARPGAFREKLVARAHEWFSGHPEEREALRSNCRTLGLSDAPAALDILQHHLALHYYEKLLPLCGTPAAYHEYMQSHVDAEEAVSGIRRHLTKDKAVLLVGSHFGAVELIVPVLAMHRIPVTPVLRFRSDEFSRAAHDRAAQMAASGLFSSVNFIEIGKPDTPAALAMSAVLRRREVLLTMVDEKTEYSTPVSLLGRRVWGGAGIDRLLKFTPAPTTVQTVFMVRDGEKYRLESHEVSADAAMVQRIFSMIEQMVLMHPEQWYFLHEEIPFVIDEPH